MLRPRSLGLILLLATLLIYLPATLNGFVDYDDPEYVVNNPFVNQGFSLIGFKWAFENAHEANWHPLTWLSHMLDCNLFRLNPAGPHLINILFHAANTALLFALLLRLTGGRGDAAPPGNGIWPAAFIAALFAWHPLHVESVAWIAERKDVLSTFFTLLSLLSYTQYAQKRGLNGATDVSAEEAGRFQIRGFPTRDYALALAFFACALLSKAMPVTLPVLMLLLDYWPLKRLAMGQGKVRNVFRLLAEKIPFCLFSLAVCVITLHAQHLAESTLTNVPLGYRLENVVMSYIGYLGKMVWPAQLCMFYPFHAVIPRPLLVESGLILLGISALAWLERKDRPWLIVGWLWFVVTLLPVIGLVQVGSQALADRYTYFPLIGIFLAVSFSMQSLAERFPFLTKGLVAMAILILVLCVAVTEKQLTYWHDSESLFSRALEVDQSETAHIGMGNALQEKNRISDAMSEFIMAWRINPDSLLANINIAAILVEQNKLEKSVIYYQRVVPQNNWLPLADDNYGRVLVRLKRYDEAIKQFAAASEIDPLNAKPHLLTGQVLLQEGREAEAVKEFEQAVKLEPQNVDTLLLLASILSSSENSQVRNGEEARKLASQADQLAHDRVEVLDVLAMCDAEVGKFGDSVLIQEHEIELLKAAGQTDGLDVLQKRLELYKKRQPWRQSFKQN
jgi:protein O-mannosyl-transferase